MPTMTPHSPGPARQHEAMVGRPPQRSIKIIIVGGFGVGKTTLITSVSQVPPLTTEVVMSPPARQLDDLTAVPGKTATTAALDWARVSLPTSVVVYLYATPGQARFAYMWNSLRIGAAGALVLVDPRRFEDCFPAVDYVERVGLPYAVLVNAFDETPTPAVADIRAALTVDASVPVLSCDVRDRALGERVLLALVQHINAGVLRRVTAQAPLPPRLFVPHTSPLDS